MNTSRAADSEQSGVGWMDGWMDGLRLVTMVQHQHVRAEFSFPPPDSKVFLNGSSV